MDQNRIELRAIRFAEAFYEHLGWKVLNVSKVRGSHAGYDLLLEQNSERLTVEVKGCSSLYQIPDLYETEIDRETKRLAADELCVVYWLADDHPPQLARIPREALEPEYITPKLGYRISGRFKNERSLEKFMVDFEHHPWIGSRSEGSDEGFSEGIPGS